MSFCSFCLSVSSCSVLCCWVSSCSAVAFQLRQRNAPRPLELYDGVGLEQPLEIVDLLGPPGQHDGQPVCPDADHLTTENPHQLDHLGAFGRAHCHRYQHELALDRLGWRQLVDRNHV